MDINKDKTLHQYMEEHPENELGMTQITKGKKEKILNICKKFGVSLLICGWLVVTYYFLGK